MIRNDVLTLRTSLYSNSKLLILLFIREGNKNRITVTVFYHLKQKTNNLNLLECFYITGVKIFKMALAYLVK